MNAYLKDILASEHIADVDSYPLLFKWMAPILASAHMDDVGDIDANVESELLTIIDAVDRLVGRLEDAKDQANAQKVSLAVLNWAKNRVNDERP